MSALDPDVIGPRERGPHPQTRVVVEILEEMRDHGAGDLTPRLDDIYIAFRERVGGGLDEAKARVRKSLDTALEWLARDGLYSVKVTDFYAEHYRGLPGDEKHPKTQADIVRSVAGSSVGASTVAIHFCPTDNCVLFMQAFDHNARSGEQKVVKTVGRMSGMAEYGLLTSDGIASIATNAGLQPRKDISKAMRIAAGVGQRRLPEKAS